MKFKEEIQNKGVHPEQQAALLPNLEQLFSLDLVSCPRLKREEEGLLTRRVRAAWSQLLTILQEQQELLVTLQEGQKPLVVDDQLSEREVLRRLHCVQAYLYQTEGQRNAAPNSVLHLWVERVQEQLSCFRVCRDEMVRRNLRLVVLLARRYQGRGLGLLDLVQEGALGLMRAVEKFDPERHVAFSSYAVWWIRQAFLRALLHKEESAAFFPHDDTCPTIQLVSLDAPLRDDAANTLADLLATPEEDSPEELVLNTDETQRLHRTLTQLPPQEADILRLRFGIVDGAILTYEAISHRLGLSREQVRLREQRALLRLKQHLQTETTKGSFRRGRKQSQPSIPVSVRPGWSAQSQGRSVL